MANQRLIRAWKPRWKRGKRRPTRWNASFNSNAAGVLNTYQVLPAGFGALAPCATLVSGQVDVEPWADDQEVTLDRVVGKFTMASVYDRAAGGAVPPYVRMGLLVHEEAEIAGPGGLDELELALNEQEVWEDFEWMWMWSGLLVVGVTSLDGETLQASREVDIDCRVRRKIGQSDELLLFAQYLNFPAGGSVGSNIELVADVRCILMSR